VERYPPGRRFTVRLVAGRSGAGQQGCAWMVSVGVGVPHAPTDNAPGLRPCIKRKFRWPIGRNSFAWGVLGLFLGAYCSH
jgi:hypothetical protein